MPGTSINIYMKRPTIPLKLGKNKLITPKQLVYKANEKKKYKILKITKVKLDK